MSETMRPIKRYGKGPAVDAPSSGGGGGRAAAAGSAVASHFTSSGAKRTVLVALALTGVVTVVSDVAHHETPDVPRLLIGLLLAGVMLTLIAEPLPELATMLAALILIATLLQSGPTVVTAATRRIGTPTPKGTLA